jgi:hypothetical protein
MAKAARKRVSNILRLPRIPFILVGVSPADGYARVTGTSLTEYPSRLPKYKRLQM